MDESGALTPVNKNAAFRKDYKAEKAQTEDRLLKGNLRETLGRGYTGFVRNLWENKDLRDDSFVWVEGEVSADKDYQHEAESNPDNDIPTHIPTDGYYLKATNANKKASQADRVGWYVAGAFKPNRIIGDSEARSIIDKWNAEHPSEPVEYDFPRESGKDFEPGDTRFSKKVYGGNSGYVGYSKSKGAVDAEERGLRNKSQMDRGFAVDVNRLIEERTGNPSQLTLKAIKDSLDDIMADEWHHTSMYGNRTNYYSAETIARHFARPKKKNYDIEGLDDAVKELQDNGYSVYRSDRFNDLTFSKGSVAGSIKLYDLKSGDDLRGMVAKAEQDAEFQKKVMTSVSDVVKANGLEAYVDVHNGTSFINLYRGRGWHDRIELGKQEDMNKMTPEEFNQHVNNAITKTLQPFIDKTKEYNKVVGEYGDIVDSSGYNHYSPYTNNTTISIKGGIQVKTDRGIYKYEGITNNYREYSYYCSLGNNMTDVKRQLEQIRKSNGEPIEEERLARFSRGNKDRLRIREFSERFDRELDAFKANNHHGLLHLGTPGPILHAIGVTPGELTLSPSVLNKHLRKHNLTTDDLKGLVYAIQHPIFAYKHGKNHPNIVVVTDTTVKGGKLSVALELDQDGNVVEISNISSIHNKDSLKEITRLENFSENEFKTNLKWVEKEKVLSWLGLPYMEERPTVNPKLLSLAKVINEFENPKLSEEKNNLTSQSLTNISRAEFQDKSENKAEVKRIESNVGEVDAEKGDVRFSAHTVLKGKEKEDAIKDLMNVTGRSRRTVRKQGDKETEEARIRLVRTERLAFCYSRPNCRV